MAILKDILTAQLRCALGVLLLLRGVSAAEAPTEYQVKAVFLFNFSHFVEWPAQAFGAATQPFAVCIVGADPFGSRLDEAVHGEQIGQHSLVVRRLRNIGEAAECQILFFPHSEAAQLRPALAELDHRGVLTVSDVDGAAESGVMIQFATENNRIRLRINVEAARAAGLTISSKLLRPAEIVGTAGGG